MKHYATFFFALGLIFFASCSQDNYPENMNPSERKAYYDEFNTSRSEEEWATVREKRKSEEPVEGQNNMEKLTDRNPASIPVSIRNNSLFPRKVRIKENVLAFKPFETRFVGFPAGTKCFLIRGQSEKYLFTINETSRNNEFTLFH